jgi:hypothetical protein
MHLHLHAWPYQALVCTSTFHSPLVHENQPQAWNELSSLFEVLQCILLFHIKLHEAQFNAECWLGTWTIGYGTD